MSQKQAKKKRREEKEEEKNAAKPMAQIIIDVYPDLSVNVNNFPSDHHIAMVVMCNALLRISAYIIEHQQTNNKSDILLARPGASQADIIKMAAGN